MKKPKQSIIEISRLAYHKSLLSSGVLCLDSKAIPSNADCDNRTSVELARYVYDKIGEQVAERLAGQMAGTKFEQLTREFLKSTFPKLNRIRPGKWSFPTGRQEISLFQQYAHLAHVEQATKDDWLLRASLGSGYLISPDVTIARESEPDEEINRDEFVVDKSYGRFAPIRSANHDTDAQKFLLHASISCKWTIRSDRVQNSRSEALNLIRNRKGQTPHIVVVTGEPLPSRLCSIALGTGDIDCVYHFALQELIEAVENSSHDDSKEMLNIMVQGKRLKDISDLPLDLSV
jgi:NgoMIV restriction enzyme